MPLWTSPKIGTGGRVVVVVVEAGTVVVVTLGGVVGGWVLGVVGGGVVDGAVVGGASGRRSPCGSASGGGTDVSGVS